jgi:hypothetical protein
LDGWVPFFQLNCDSISNCDVQSAAKVIRAHPYVAAVLLLTMAAIMTAGVVGVLAAADTETRHRKDAATGVWGRFLSAHEGAVTAAAAGIRSQGEQQ